MIIVSLALIFILLIILISVISLNKENFEKNYDKNCIATCQTQSINADDQCENDCELPKNNNCWEYCFKKSKYFDDYLRCGQRCPYIYLV